MISAFKHIRLSGYNLIPTTGDNSVAKLSFNSKDLAFYQDLTGVSGYLAGLIDTANSDVSSINNIQGAITFNGGNGISIIAEGSTIYISGNDQAVQTALTNLTTNLGLTGSTLDAKIGTLSGHVDSTFVKNSTQQIFKTSLTTGNDTFTISFPTPFDTTPKVLVSLEIPGDIMYNTTIKNITSGNYTLLLSDILLEENASIHTFASKSV